MDRLKELKEQLDKNKGRLTNEMLDEIVESIHQALENKLISVVLYGSYARGNTTDESDVDIALLVNGELNKDEDDALVHNVSILCLKHDIVISANDIDVKKFEQWVSILPYYKNIEKEGIVLWKAA